MRSTCLDEATITAVRRRGIQRASDRGRARHHAAEQRDDAVAVLNRLGLNDAGVVDHAGQQRFLGASIQNHHAAVSLDQTTVFHQRIQSALVNLHADQAVFGKGQGYVAASTHGNPAFQGIKNA